MQGKTAGSLGEQLRTYRGKRHVSAQELAEEMGWAYRSEITRREKGQTGMDEEELLRICAGVERILKRRAKARTPADVLEHGPE